MTYCSQIKSSRMGSVTKRESGSVFDSVVLVVFFASVCVCLCVRVHFGDEAETH